VSVNTAESDRWLSRADAAARAGLSTRQLDRLIAAGKIPSIVIGTSRRIRMSALDAALEAMSAPHVPRERPQKTWVRS
jgi:excisionase family DNA binding protein